MKFGARKLETAVIVIVAVGILCSLLVASPARAERKLSRMSEHRPYTVGVGIINIGAHHPPPGAQLPQPNCAPGHCGEGCTPANCAIGCGYCGDGFCNPRFEDDFCEDCKCTGGHLDENGFCVLPVPHDTPDPDRTPEPEETPRPAETPGKKPKPQQTFPPPVECIEGTPIVLPLVGEDGGIIGYANVCPRFHKVCFAPETRILMADRKTTKRIYEIAYGEEVWNPVLNKAVPVRHLTAGPEQAPMLEIGYEDASVRVTLEHPMIVLDNDVALRRTALRPDGSLPRLKLKQARSVTHEDSILGADGEYHRVQTVTRLPRKEGQAVWNLNLDTDDRDPREHAIVADGIVTGDVRMQIDLREAINGARKK